MHPVLARYLDPDVLREALASDGDDAELLRTASAWAPAERTVLEAATTASDDGVQQAALTLATFAALKASEDDPQLALPLQHALGALMATGTSQEEARQMLALAFLDEAFAFDVPDLDFDAALVAETVASIGELVKLNDGDVDVIVQAFSHQTNQALRPLHYAATTALLSTAWDQGPQPITPEHAERALVRLLAERPGDELDAALDAVQALLKALSGRGLVGPLRLARLNESLALYAEELRDELEAAPEAVSPDDDATPPPLEPQDDERPDLTAEVSADALDDEDD
ncbi:MAG: hypothetical protein K1X89_16985 [Myxococcaceae bacterium]|nr:hypothetical protein [Myxococcaceae bacterium]